MVRSGFLAGFEYLINALVIVVIGHKGNARTQDLLRAYWSKTMPNGMVMQIEPGDPLPPGHPASGRGMEGGQPTALHLPARYLLQPLYQRARAGKCADPAAADARPAAAAAGKLTFLRGPSALRT